MTDEIDTSAERVERLAGLLEALDADAGANADGVVSDLRAEVKRLRQALEDIESITPLWEGGMGVSKVNLANTLEEARQIARAALHKEGGKTDE